MLHRYQHYIPTRRSSDLGEDANAIVEQLRTDNVPYELSDGGATILVPEEHVYDQRLKSAAAGLPTSSNGGYSLLDDMGVTSDRKSTRLNSSHVRISYAVF